MNVAEVSKRPSCTGTVWLSAAKEPPAATCTVTGLLKPASRVRTKVAAWPSTMEALTAAMATGAPTAVMRKVSEAGLGLPPASVTAPAVSCTVTSPSAMW